MVSTRPDFGCCRLVEAEDDPFIVFQSRYQSTLFLAMGPGWDAIRNMAVTLLVDSILSRKSNDMVTTRPALG
jgi:hypothetical protein